MSTSQLISAGRAKLELTVQAFADRCGVSRGAVQQWEKGTTAPSRRRAPVVAKVLGLTVADLIGGHAESVALSVPGASYQPSPLALMLAELFDKLPDDPQVKASTFNSIYSVLIAAELKLVEQGLDSPAPGVPAKKQGA